MEYTWNDVSGGEQTVPVERSSSHSLCQPAPSHRMEGRRLERQSRVTSRQTPFKRVPASSRRPRVCSNDAAVPAQITELTAADDTGD
ncbi:hypothetical protein LSAT2_010834 [Lamellibrachia satsuma]|nr:hypothetical protein LSAT2_010834 [Lamellibrachia satsuma]